MNARNDAVSRLPPQLRSGQEERWAVVQRTEGVDQTSITLINVSPVDSELCLELQEWFFDEDQLVWVQESRSETWLAPSSGARLAGLLQQHCG